MSQSCEPEEAASPDPVAERLLEAAYARFEEEGVRSTTMTAIAQAAGVGRATLYRYFPGKTVLVQALVLREARRLMTLIDDALMGADDTETLLERGLLAALRYLRTHPVLRRVLAEEPASILPALTVHGAPLLSAAVEFATPHAERAMKAGQLPKGDPAVVAEWTARALLSLVLTPSVVVDLDDPEQAERFVRHIVPTGGRR